MPPKVKVTKEAVVSAAIEIVRTGGPAALNARTVATALQCSTQPVFSNFATMELLHQAVADEAENIYRQYIGQEIATGRYPSYKATGMAYIRFAREEPELFRLLYMQDRRSKPIPQEHELTNQVTDLVQQSTGLDRAAAGLLHLEMWSLVHGIAVMMATGYMALEEELISRMLTDMYQGLRQQSERT